MDPEARWIALFALLDVTIGWSIPPGVDPPGFRDRDKGRGSSILKKNVMGKFRTNFAKRTCSKLVSADLVHLRWKWCFHAPDRLFLLGWCFKELIPEFIRWKLMEPTILKPKAAMVAEKEAQRSTRCFCFGVVWREIHRFFLNTATSIPRFEIRTPGQGKRFAEGIRQAWIWRPKHCNWLDCLCRLCRLCVHLKDSVLQIHGGASGMGDMPGLGYLAKFDSAAALLLFPFLSINNRLLDCFFEVLFQWKWMVRKCWWLRPQVPQADEICHKFV